jgi:sensor c-di-GMP phosphodiesterase-like protein
VRRRRRLALVCLAALAAGLLGAFAVARVTWGWESRQTDILLAEQLRTTQELARGLFAEALARMDRVGEQWTGDCGEAAIQLLRNLVFYSASIREATFLDGGYNAVCSNYGPPPSPFALASAERNALQRGGVSVSWVAESAAMKAQAVAVNRVAAKGTVNALIDPTFLDQAIERDVIQSGMWSGLQLADGAVMAGSGSGDQVMDARLFPALSGDPSWKLVAGPVEAVPVTAIAAMRKPTLAHVRRAHWGLISGMGLVSAGAAFALGMALLRRRESLDAELKRAIAKNELTLHYQPLIDLETRRCVGAEALMRWNHPERGMVRPDLFIPQAEESGMILPMTEWLLQRVAADFADGPPAGEPFHVSINLTGRHFQTPGMVDKLQDAFGKSALKPMQIVLEATERQVMQGAEGGGQDMIAAARRWGAAVSLDDFGTGYCGLKYLQQYRVDYLKIDKSFVDSIGTDAVSAHVVDAIIDLARKLGIAVVAEGVEREDQAQYLKSRGVQYAQGYLFAKPMPLGEFLAFARRK